MSDMNAADPRIEVASQDTMDQIARALHPRDERVIEMVEQALQQHPRDARLWMVQGCNLASEGQLAAAREALRRAVSLSPSLHAAWFMLGCADLFEGNVDGAASAWHVLDDLPSHDPLSLCAQGLTSLVHDDFDDAAIQLGQALETNTLYPALDSYIATVLAAIHEHVAKRAEPSDGANSDQHLLLSGYLSGMTRQ
jgi:Flp pilus assembly protein TadD